MNKKKTVTKKNLLQNCATNRIKGHFGHPHYEHSVCIGRGLILYYDNFSDFSYIKRDDNLSWLHCFCVDKKDFIHQAFEIVNDLIDDFDINNYAL